MQCAGNLIVFLPWTKLFELTRLIITMKVVVEPNFSRETDIICFYFTNVNKSVAKHKMILRTKSGYYYFKLLCNQNMAISYIYVHFWSISYLCK